MNRPSHPSMWLMPLAIMMSVVTQAKLATSAEPSDANSKKQVASGDMAVDFTLPIVSGTGELTLSEEYLKGPVVLIVLRGYPGYQCPLCSRQVGELVTAADKIGEVAKRVIFVYPGEPDQLEQHAEEFMGKTALPAPLVLVRDPGLQMVTDWRLRWDAPRETAYPATYIIDHDGKVRWSKVSKSHGGRTSAREIIEQLKAL